MIPSFRPSRPVVIGLMGGIASGKSTIGQHLASAGLVVVNADRLAHTALTQPAVRDRIREVFGDRVIDAQGAVDREALRDVFGDPEELKKLEEIVHPIVNGQIETVLQRSQQHGHSVVLDVPLLIESGLIDRCHATLFVDTDARERSQRAQQRGWNGDELRRRESAQTPLPVKKSRATAIIRGSCSIEHMREQVGAFLAQLSPTESQEH